MHPARLEVLQLISSRYDSGEGSGHATRPSDWDERRGGVDIVKVSGGATVRLSSSPMQSPPKPGWVVMLTGGNENEGYTWTLYGLSASH